MHSPSPERKPLPDAPAIPRSRLHPLATSALAAAGLALGCVAVSADLWSVPLAMGAFPAPPGLIASLGAGLAAFSLIALAAGLRAAMRGARLRARAADNPQEPWLGDHEWHAQGTGEIRDPSAARTLRGAACLALVLLPLNVWAFSVDVWESHRPAPWDRPLELTLALLDLVVLAALARGLVGLARQWGRGASHLVYRRFPFFTGSKLEVQLLSSGVDLRACRCLILRLRLVEETWEKHGWRSRRLRAQLYADEQTLSPETLSGARGGLQVAFGLPRAVPGTQLTTEPLRYWELEIQGEAPGHRYRARFLLPVYSPPPELVARLNAAAVPEEQEAVDLQVS